jgi:uncharacterized delta-60 repeat protein
MKNINLFLVRSVLSISLITTASFAKEQPKKTIKDAPAPKELRTLSQKAYGGSSKDKAYSVISLKDGGVLIGGYSKSYGRGRGDMLIIKMDKNGKILYRSSYGGKKKDHAKALTATSDGYFMAVGGSKSFSKNNDEDVYVVKFDKDGKRVWQKTYGGDREDSGLSIVATNGGGALITGYTESYGKGYKDVYIIYIDKDGKEIWSKAIGGKDDDQGNAITLSADGGFYVAGQTRSYGSRLFDFYLLKFDGNGKFLYDVVYGEQNDDILKAITPTQDGGCVVAGSTKSFGSKYEDIDIIKYDKKGKQIWHKIFGFKSKEWANAITRMPNGGFLVAGTTKSFGFGANDFYLIELNSKGSSIWANVYGGENKDMAHSVTRTTDGRYIVVGETESYGSGDYDFMILDLKKK